MKIVLLCMIGFLLVGCISTHEMYCSSEYEIFSDRLSCFKQVYSKEMKNFQAKTQYGGKYTYDEAQLCADNLTALVSKGSVSDEDAWSVFLRYYFEPEESGGACNVDGILSEIRERGAIQQLEMDRKIEKATMYRN